MNGVSDKSQFKSILEDDLIRPDLLQILRELGLPQSGGRKCELVERILQLIDDKYYDLDQIQSVKQKITEVFNQRRDVEEMAPTGRNFIHDVGSKRKGRKRSTALNQKPGSKRKTKYTVLSSEEELSDGSDDSIFVVSDDRTISTASSSSSDHQFGAYKPKAKNKRKKKTKKVIKLEESQESDSDSDSDSRNSDDSGSSSSSSSGLSTSIFDKYAKTRNKRKKDLEALKKKREEKKRKKKANNLKISISNEKKTKRKTNLKKYESTSEESENSDQNTSSDDEVIHMETIKKRSPRKVPPNRILSSSEEENVMTSIPNPSDSGHQIHDSDDDIEILEELPLGTTTIVRTDYKFIGSSDTYSDDSDMDISDNNLTADKPVEDIESLEAISPEPLCDTNHPDLLDLEEIEQHIEQQIDRQIAELSNTPGPDTPITSLLSPISDLEDQTNTVNENHTETAISESSSDPLPPQSTEIRMEGTPTITSSSSSKSKSNPLISEEPKNVDYEKDKKDTKLDSKDTLKYVKNEFKVCDKSSSLSTPTIESVELSSSEPESPEPESPQIKPPEPQLPNYLTQMVQVRTPNRVPYEITVWKNGQAHKVPPPPKLPPALIFRVIKASETIAEVKKRLNNSSDEIEAIDQTLKISLICPITNQRVKTPSRSISCHHFDCFDINSFLEINFNKKIEDWKCPKCKQPARTYQLIIDSLIWHILTHNSVNPSVEAVIFDNKAVWVPDIKLPEIYHNQNKDSNTILLDASADDVIELGDSDEEQNIPVTNPQQKPKINITVIKPVVPNLSNQPNINQSVSGVDDHQMNELLQILRSAQEELHAGQHNTDQQERVTRWSNTTTRLPPPALRIPPLMPINSAANTLRNAAISVQINSQRSTAPMLRQIRPQVQTHTSQQPSRGPPVVSVNSLTHTSTNSVSQNLNDCTLKFTFGSDGTLNVSCPLCNETFSDKTAEQHTSSAKHRALLNSRAQPNVAQPAQNNINRNPCPIPPIQSIRQPIRTYSNNGNYAPNTYNNVWNQTHRTQQPQQQPLYNTNYQMAFQTPTITNNFYNTQTPAFIQQVAPAAHQSNMVPQPAHNNSFNDPTNSYTAFPNQPNGYYNF